MFALVLKRCHGADFLRLLSSVAGRIERELCIEMEDLIYYKGFY